MLLSYPARSTPYNNTGRSSCFGRCCCWDFSYSVGLTHKVSFACASYISVYSFFTRRGEKRIYRKQNPCACIRPMALTLRAIVIGIGAVIGAIIAGSVVGYEVVLHCAFSCALFQ